jgi:hypothetical protein
VNTCGIADWQVVDILKMLTPADEATDSNSMQQLSLKGYSSFSSPSLSSIFLFF